MLTCPTCKAPLEPVTYRKITIDKCTQCEGVWLDKGEEPFVMEVLNNANQAACRDCNHFASSKRMCNLMKIYVQSTFSCANFNR